MAYVESIEKIIGHVAWPMVFIFIFLFLRKEISLLLSRITKAKYKDLEIDLRKTMGEIRNEAENLGITIAYPESYFPKESIENLKDSPEWAFIKSWQEIEDVLSPLVGVGSQGEVRRRSVNAALDELLSKKLIEPEMAAIVQKVRGVRNKIVHSPEAEASVTRGEALEWLGISRSICDRLRQIVRRANQS